MDLIIRVTRVTNYVGRRVSSSTKRPNATSKRYLKTQALMGATRLASVIVIVQQLFSWGAFPFYFPDNAGRVAPIRASVSSSTKRYH